MADDDTSVSLLSKTDHEDEDEDAREGKHGGAGFGISVFNLMNCILGGGLLALPHALAKSGIVLFFLLFVIMAGCAYYSISLLLAACAATNITAYQDLGERAYGRLGGTIVCLSIIIQNMGSMTSYLIVVKTSGFAATGVVNKCMSLSHLPSQNLMLILFSVTILYPLALLKKIEWIGYSSAISIFFLFCFIIAVVVQYFQYPCDKISGVHSCSVEAVDVTLDTFFVLPTMALSFVCHTNLLPIYHELRDRSEKKMMGVATSAIGLSFSLYSLTAVCGYLTFGSLIEGNILDAYADFDVHSYNCFIRIGLVISFAFTVPLLLFPVRLMVTKLLEFNAPSVLVDKQLPTLLHFVVTAVILATCCILAIVVPGIADVFGVTGATASVSLVFIMPGMFFLKVMKEIASERQMKMARLYVFVGGIIGSVSLAGVIVALVV